MSRLIPILAVLLMSAGLLSGQVWSPDQARSDPIDSTLAWMKKNFTADSNQYHKIALLTLARAYQSGNNELIGDAHFALWDWHDYHVLFGVDSALYHSRKALEFYQRAGIRTREAEMLNNLANDYLRKSMYDEAQQALFDAIKIYESLGNQRGVAIAYKYLAILFEESEDPEQSINYASQAIEIFKSHEDYYNHSITLWSLIHSHRMLKQYDQAIAAANQCIDIVDTHIPEELAIKTRGYAYRGDAEAEKGDYYAALESHRAAYAIVEGAIGPDRPATKTYRASIGDDLRRLGKPEEALPHQLAGIQGQLDLGVTKIWKEYAEVTETYKALGDFEKALEYQAKGTREKYAMLEDKIKNLETEAVAKYESGKKDQALAEQEQQLKQQRKIQLLVAGIAGMLALLLGILFYNYRRNKKTTALLAKRNTENELLLKEIHHRVKNNLSIVSGLLTLQGDRVDDPDTHAVMRATQNRVQAMGILHQKLYKGQNLDAIEMKDYLLNLSEGVLDAFDADQRIEIELAMDELELDVDTAVPIGLIVNELLTNALKYAFPEERKGKVQIQLKEINASDLLLEIADNGIGADFSAPAQGTGFGTQLIQLLTQQLQGSIDTEISEGTRISLRLKKSNAA